MDKSADAFRTISEAADELDLPQHVLRFWETRFSQIKPLKRGGGRRYYRPEDVQLLSGIRHLLYDHGYTIKGVQRILKEKGVKVVVAATQGAPLPTVEGGLNAADSAAAPEMAPDMGQSLAQSQALGEPVNVPQNSKLSSLQVRKLNVVLGELLDCKRTLDQARLLG